MWVRPVDGDGGGANFAALQSRSGWHKYFLRDGWGDTAKCSGAASRGLRPVEGEAPEAGVACAFRAVRYRVHASVGVNHRFVDNKWLAVAYIQIYADGKGLPGTYIQMGIW
jgi:hypothetical protein